MRLPVPVWISFASTMLLTACGEDLAELSLRAMAQCQEGGLVFEVGEDLDGDGVVSAEETSATYVFCLETGTSTCAAAGATAEPGRMTWWDGTGQLYRRATCRRPDPG